MTKVHIDGRAVALSVLVNSTAVTKKEDGKDWAFFDSIGVVHLAGGQIRVAFMNQGQEIASTPALLIPAGASMLFALEKNAGLLCADLVI